MSAYEPRTVGWWMDERRGELGMTWEEVAEGSGVSTETLYRAASGRPMRTTTRKGIERALHWEYGSIDAILDGGEPTPLPEPEPEPERPHPADRLEELETMAETLRTRIQELRSELETLRQPGEQRRIG